MSYSFKNIALHPKFSAGIRESRYRDITQRHGIYDNHSLDHNI